MAISTTFDPAFQESHNGPLADAAITRLSSVQSASKLTLDQIGAKLGLSGSFLGNLMRGYAYKGRPTAIRTKHVDRIKTALLDLEAAYGLRPVATNDEPAPNSGPVTDLRPIASLETHVRAIHVLGFAVTLTPLAASPR
jgi:hypothetical protein